MPQNDWVLSRGAGGLTGNGLSNLFMLDHSQIIQLAETTATVSLESLVFNNFSEYCRSIVWFPIWSTTLANLNAFEREAVRLKLGYTLSSLDVFGRPAVGADNNMRFVVGTVSCPILHDDYRDYEPYSSYEIYIPYYGFGGLKAADILGDTLTLSICLDWTTGQGTYYLENSNRLIGKYTAQIGVPIKFGQTGATDTARNLIMGAVKSSAAIAGALISPIIGANVNTYESVSSGNLEDFSEVRSQWAETGRLRKSGETKRNQSWETTKSGTRTYNSWKGRVANGCFDMAASAIANLQFHPQVDRSNNPASDGIGSLTPRLIIKQARVRDIDTSYRQIYGLPYGKTTLLSNVSGYTKCSSVRLSAKNFGTITSGELSLIEQFLLSGVVFGGDGLPGLQTPIVTTSNMSATITFDDANTQVLEVYIDGNLVSSISGATSPLTLSLSDLGFDTETPTSENKVVTIYAKAIPSASVGKYISSTSSPLSWTITPIWYTMLLTNFPNVSFATAALSNSPIVTVTINDTGFVGKIDGTQIWTWEYEGEYLFEGLYTDDIGVGIGTKTYTSGESFIVGGLSYGFTAELTAKIDFSIIDAN